MLLNSEVVQLLQDRGAFNTDRFSAAAPIEKQAAEFLKSICGTAPHDSKQCQALRAKLNKYALASSEVFQLINLRPSTAVEVFLIVEDMEERFGDEAEQFADDIIVLISSHAPTADAVQPKQS